MSTTDDARLDALDRRGRAAATTLLDDLAARDAAGPRLVDLDRPVDAGAVRVVRGRRPGGRGVGGRRWLVAAAVVALLAAVGGVVAVAGRDDAGPDVSSGGRLDPLLPRWLPTGFEAARAVDVSDPAAMGYGADVAVYGDADADDPWPTLVGVVHLVADEELLGGSSSDGEPVTVAGHDARIRESEGLDGHTPAWEVEWQVDDGRLVVTGALDRDEVLAAAETATTEPSLDTSGLPDGYAELARGPMQDLVLFSSLYEGAIGGLDRADGPDDRAGLAVTYVDAADRRGVRSGLVVAQRPGPSSAVDLLRLSFPDAEDGTVRGRHAVVGRGEEPPGSAGEAGVVAVQWAEPEGQLVTVVGFGVDEDDVLRVAEGLRPAAPGEVAALRDDDGDADAAPREFDDVPPGDVVVASGDSPTGRWRIVAEPRRSANIGALTVERMSGALASTSSTTGDRTEPPLDLGADFSDATAVVWGILWVDAATVAVEAPGLEPVPLEIHEVEGWDHPVVAGSFPYDQFAAVPDDVVVVARDADGREVARNDTVLASGG